MGGFGGGGAAYDVAVVDFFGCGLDRTEAALEEDSLRIGIMIHQSCIPCLLEITD